MTTNTASPDMISADTEPTTRVRVSDQDELNVWVRGEGTPVVLSHGAFWPDLLAPLMAELVQTNDYQVIRYHRRGFGEKPTGPVDLSVQAGDIVRLLDALEIDKAHVFGHSYGAQIVLELVTLSPDRVRSAISAEHVAGFQTEAEEGMAEIFALAFANYENGDRRGAATAFFAPLGVSQALIDQIPLVGIDTFFQAEFPALTEWTLDLAKLENTETPIAWIYSDKSPPFQEAGAALQERVPETTAIEIPDSDHFFVFTKPAETAAAIHDWFMSQDAT